MEWAVDEHETPADVARSILGPMSDEEVTSILWGCTAFPFGTLDLWIRQLMDLRVLGEDSRTAW
jgi:hypothetical protein